MLTAIIFFLAAAACFEGAETSLLSINEVRLQTLIKKGDHRALIVGKLRSNVRTLLGTLLLGQTVCDIAAASLATLVAHNAFGDSGVAGETVVLTIIVLIFVNLIPKAHAANNPEPWALRVARPVSVLMTVLHPAIAVIDRFVSLFVEGRGVQAMITEEEIRTMIHLGVKSGGMERGEKELIERVFLLNDITAGDILTPKEIMVTLDADKSIIDALPFVNSSKFSRFPLWSGDKENIVGIVNIKNLFERLSSSTPNELLQTPLRELATSPTFILETDLVDDLFRSFKKNRIHMAIVVDNERRLVGLVTHEDLLEELVGEISDESDVDEHLIKRIDKLTILAHGDTDIPDINRFFNSRIESGDERTIGRLVQKKAGKLPKQGQSVTIADGLTAVIEQASHSRILRVRLVKTI